MIYLLDTNVVSESMRTVPHAGVMNWLRSLPAESLAISSLTVGELRKGAEKPHIDPVRRERLRQWLAFDLEQWLGPRILPVDQAVAERWGRLVAASSRTLPAVDALIGATALQHNLRLATRNTADFASLPGLELLNPWQL